MASNLVNITHEAGNISEYTGTVLTATGDTATAEVAAAMGGTNYGLQIYTGTVSAGNLTYAYKNFTSITSTTYRWRYYFNPNGQTGIGTSYMDIAQANNTVSNYTELTVGYVSSNFKLQLWANSDALGDFGTSAYTITNAAHYVECRLKKSSTSSATDAELSLYVDGTLKETKTGFLCYTHFAVSRMSVGVTYANQSSRTLYFDQVIFRDSDDVIGPTNLGTSALTVPIATSTASGTVTPGTKTGTVTLTLPITTSTASGTYKHKSSTGVITLAICALACSGTIKHIGTSTNNLPIITSTASATYKHKITSTNTLPMATQGGGSGTVKHIGTSTITLPMITQGGGAGTVKHIIASTLTLPINQLTSNGCEHRSATSTLSLPIITQGGGSGIVKHIGTSDNTLPIVSITSNGMFKRSGTSSTTLPIVNLSANGVFKRTGTSDLTLPMITQGGGDGTVKHVGTSVLDLPINDLRSQGNFKFTGTSDLSALIVSLDGSGIVKHVATSDLNLPIISIFSMGSKNHGNEGIVDFSLPIISLDNCNGTIKHFGTSDLTLPINKSCTHGTVEHIGTSTIDLPIISLNANGAFHQFGSSDLSLPIINLSAQDKITHFGISNLLLPIIDLSAQDKITHFGTSNLTLPIITSDTEATRKTIATSTLNLPIITLDGAGAKHQFGMSDLLLPIIDLTSSSIEKIVGTSTLSLSIINLSANGTNKHIITSVNTLPIATITSAGIVKHSGDSAITLPEITLSSIAGYHRYGTSDLTLPIISLDSAGGRFKTGTSFLTLPIINLTASGATINHGTSANILPIAIISTSGINKHSISSINNLPIVLISTTGINKHSATSANTLPKIILPAYGKTYSNVGVSIKSRIKNALIEGLKTITLNNGYDINLKEINSEPKSFELMRNFPAVNLVWGDETYQEPTHSSGYLFKTAIMNLDFFLSNNNNIDLERSKVIKSVEKYILNNYNLPSIHLEKATCNLVKVINNESWGIASSKNHGGITIQIEINYNQNLFDPYSRTQGTTSAFTDSELNSTVSFHEYLTDSIFWNLQQITKANSFKKNLYTNRDIQSYETIRNFPFANVIKKSEDYLEQGQDRWVKKKITYIIDVYIQNVNSVNADIEAITADIEKKVFNNYKMINKDGYRTCTESYIKSVTPFNWESPKPKGGLQMILEVYYRQDLENPNQPQV